VLMFVIQYFVINYMQEQNMEYHCR